MKRGKKSQTTIFIILAIILVAFLLLFFLTKKDVLDLTALKVNPQVKPIYSFTQSCVEQTAQNAIQHIGENGGYYISPNNSLYNGIPIYFDKGKTSVPTKEQIEKELSKYVDEMLFFCTKNFAEFQDFEVKQDKIKTTTQIINNKVIFKINYPLSILKEGNSYTFNNFETEIPVRLSIVQEVAEKMIQEQKEFPEDLCFTCIEDLAIKNQVVIKMIDFQDSVIFTIVDINSQINTGDFAFYFANKY